MRAAILEAFKQPMVIGQHPDPVPAAGQVVLKTMSCGICGTDIHLNEGEHVPVPLGCVLGHEFSGEVVAVGANVIDLTVGDRVTALPFISCGECLSCRRGQPAQCPKMETIGAGNIPGAYSEYTLATAMNCLRLPDSLSYDDGALMEPLSVSLRGVRAANLNLASRVAVLGVGPIGMAAIFWSRRLGASRIVAVAPSRNRAQLAETMGADGFVTLEEGTEAVADALGGAPDVVIECTGHPGMIARGIEMVGYGGTVIVLGFCSKPDFIPSGTAVFKEAAIKFVFGYDLDTYRHAISTMASGIVDPRLMITDVVNLDAFPAAFEQLRARSHQCKVIVRPNG